MCVRQSKRGNRGVKRDGRRADSKARTWMERSTQHPSMPTASHPNKRPKRSSHSSSTLSDPASSPSDTDTDPRARRRTINTTVGTKRKRGVSEASSVRSGRAPRRDHSKTVSDVGRKIVGRAGKAKGDVFDKTVGVGRSSLRSEGSSTGRLDKVEMEIEDPEGFDLINSCLFPV